MLGLVIFGTITGQQRLRLALMWHEGKLLQQQSLEVEKSKTGWPLNPTCRQQKGHTRIIDPSVHLARQGPRGTLAHTVHGFRGCSPPFSGGVWSWSVELPRRACSPTSALLRPLPRLRLRFPEKPSRSWDRARPAPPRSRPRRESPQAYAHRQRRTQARRRRGPGPEQYFLLFFCELLR